MDLESPYNNLLEHAAPGEIFDILDSMHEAKQNQKEGRVRC